MNPMMLFPYVKARQMDVAREVDARPRPSEASSVIRERVGRALISMGEQLLSPETNRYEEFDDAA